MIRSELMIDLEVFRKYAGVSIPRHVSYPMPSWWHDVDEDQIAEMLRMSDRAYPLRDLSLYLHIPFCEALCKFCACHKGIQRKDNPAARALTQAYVGALEREIRMLATTVSGERVLRQVHWGGGSPTYLSDAEITRIHRAMEDVFQLADDAEVSIEVDPRGADRRRFETLRALGFNRVSLGVQDFDRKVQEHVRRIQPLEMIRECLAACREAGFNSVNFDLIYGMPYQTPETIRKTVEHTIDLAPNRIAFYHYAQIPEKIATQRGMDYAALPDSEAKLEMFLIGIELFTAAGYEFVGLDHFARPDEGLALAGDSGTLQRNFQGMTTGGGLDMLGAGASSIGHFLAVGFLQNIKETDRYIQRIESGQSPIQRGKPLTLDDRIRQTLLNRLYCHVEIRPQAIERQFDIVFNDYFARELVILDELESDGLVSTGPDGVIKVTCPLGRVLLRTVAAVFDAYLQPDAYLVGEQACFSVNA